MNRRDFLKYSGAVAVVVGAASLGITKYEDLLPSRSNSTQISSTSQISSSSSSTTSTLKNYDVTLSLFHDLHADGKQQSDEPTLKDAGIVISDPRRSGSSVYKPDKDGIIKIPNLNEGIDYSCYSADPSSLYRYITPSNSNFLQFDGNSPFNLRIDSDITPQNSDYVNPNGKKLRISPDNLHVDLPLVVGPATWPFLDSRREVVYYGPLEGGYMDISMLYGGKTRDWMGGDNTYPNHGGDDIVAPSLGTPSLSIMPGIVIDVYNNWPAGQTGDPQDPNASGSNRSGNYVRMQHPGHLLSLHTHLKDVLVEIGDFVPRGKAVGTVGYTGRARANDHENNLMLMKYRTNALTPSSYDLVDLFRALEIPGAVSYWTKDSNPQQPDDPQSPISD
jgi:murein DD-endopeptidase MepM/ murein hydrolase activator NlpD